MKLLNEIPMDKYQHYIAGTLIAAVGLYLGIGWSIGLVAIAAVGKKVVDYKLDQSPDVPEMMWDIVATMLGGAMVWIGWLAK